MATFRLPEASYNTTFVQDKEDGLRIPQDIQVKWKPWGRGKKEQAVQSSPTKGKTSHSSDWVLLTIPGLCCSSSMLLRIMQAFVTLPRRETRKNNLNGITTPEPTSELWAKGKPWGQNHSPPHNSSPVPGIKDRPPHNGPFCSCHILQGCSGASFGYQGVLFRLKSVLPNCTQEWYHYGAPHCSRDHPAPQQIQPYCSQRPWAVLPAICGACVSRHWSYEHYSVTAKYIYYLTESFSALQPCHNSGCSKDCPEVWFSYPCTIVMCKHFPTEEDTRYLEQFLAGPSSAWSQLHWQGAGLQSPESQKKQQFNLCVGSRLLLWWIICHAQSQQAGKSQRKLSSTGRLQHTAEECTVSHFCPRPFIPSKEGCCKLLVSRAAKPTAYPRSLLQLPKKKIRGVKELFPFKSRIVQFGVKAFQQQ